MYGLVQAVQSKGLNATGMKLSINDLKPNNIVFITIDGGPHYSVVREVTENSVKLADPSLGNIEMSREKFNDVYSGYTLVVSDPNATASAGNSAAVNNQTVLKKPIDETNNGTNITTLSDSQSNQTDNGTSTAAPADNGTNPADVQKILTIEEIQSIKGRLQLRCSYRWCGWRPVVIRTYYLAHMAHSLWGWDLIGYYNYSKEYMNWYRREGYNYAAR
ncbi:MAG: hypothetical protein BME94_04505 [Methanobacteriales archaeon Met13]